MYSKFEDNPPVEPIKEIPRCVICCSKIFHISEIMFTDCCNNCNIISEMFGFTQRAQIYPIRIEWLKNTITDPSNIKSRNDLIEIIKLKMEDV